MNNPLLIIPTYFSKQEHYDLFEACIKSIKATCDAEILCIDDFSPDKELLEKAKRLLRPSMGEFICKSENFGFSDSVNYGLNRCLNEGRDAVLVNQDIEFTQHGWLETMGNTEGAVIGAKLLYHNGIIQHGGVFFSHITRNFDHRFKGCLSIQPEANELCYCPVTGALQYIKLETLQQVGIYDPSFYMGYEDVDYCLRAIDAGLKCVYNPKVEAIHHESVIRGDTNIYKQGDSYLTFIRKYADKTFEMVPNMFEGEIHEV